MRRILLPLIIAFLFFAVPTFAQNFDFPASPTVGQQVTGPGGQIFQWDGTKWVALGSGGASNFAPLTNPVGGQNNYAPIAAPTFTGTLTAPTINITGNGSTLGTTNISSLTVAGTLNGASVVLQGVLNFGSAGALYFNGVPMGGTCPANQFVNTINAQGVPSCVAAAGSFAPILNPAGGQNNYAPINNATFTGLTTFPDGSSIVTSGANNGTAGFPYGFNNSTGVAIGTGRTPLNSIGGNMLILGQATTPALLLQATNFVPDGAIQFTTGVLGTEWLAHNATWDGTNWTAWGDRAEIVGFGGSVARTAIIFNLDETTTVGSIYTPTPIAQFVNNGAAAGDYTGLDILSGSLFLNGVNQFRSGTWTPTFSCTGLTPAMGSPSATGYWNTVGNMLFYTANMGWASQSSGTGNAYIGGLPFAAIDTTGGGYRGDIVVSNATPTDAGATRLLATVVNGSQAVQINDTDFGPIGYLAPSGCGNIWHNQPSGLWINGYYRYQ